MLVYQVTFLHLYPFYHGKFLPHKMSPKQYSRLPQCMWAFVNSFPHCVRSEWLLDLFRATRSAKSSQLTSGIVLLVVNCSFGGGLVCVTP